MKRSLRCLARSWQPFSVILGEQLPEHPFDFRGVAEMLVVVLAKDNQDALNSSEVMMDVYSRKYRRLLQADRCAEEHRHSIMWALLYALCRNCVPHMDNNHGSHKQSLVDRTEFGP